MVSWLRTRFCQILSKSHFPYYLLQQNWRFFEGYHPIDEPTPGTVVSTFGFTTLPSFRNTARGAGWQRGASKKQDGSLVDEHVRIDPERGQVWWRKPRLWMRAKELQGYPGDTLENEEKSIGTVLKVMVADEVKQPIESTWWLSLNSFNRLLCNSSELQPSVQSVEFVL